MKSQRVWKGDVGDRLSVSIEVNKQKIGEHVGPEVSVSHKKDFIRSNAILHLDSF